MDVVTLLEARGIQPSAQRVAPAIDLYERVNAEAAAVFWNSAFRL